LLSTSSGPAFLALRCPCHPLAVRVSHEFYQTSADLLVGCALLHRHMKRSGRRDADSDEDEEDDEEEERAVDDNNNSDAYVIRAGDVARPSRHGGGGSAASTSTTVHAAVGRVGAVLHGEETLELFHVPPCEYRQPYGVSVWIDEGSRRIVIRGTRAIDRGVTKTTATCTDVTVMAACTAGTTATTTTTTAAGQHRPQVSVSSVRQALLFKPKNERDRVVHAVLNKWAVDEEP
jgi:hypothetical protein